MNIGDKVMVTIAKNDLGGRIGRINKVDDKRILLQFRDGQKVWLRKWMVEKGEK